jgi:hypothetical protein
MVPKKLGWSVTVLMLLALVAGACAPAATLTPPSPTPTPAPKTETPTLQPSPTATFTPTATPTPDFKKLEEEVISKYFPTLKQILELPENKGAYVDWGSVEEYNIESTAKRVGVACSSFPKRENRLQFQKTLPGGTECSGRTPVTCKSL